jgi:hypothetical protein
MAESPYDFQAMLRQFRSRELTTELHTIRHRLEKRLGEVAPEPCTTRLLKRSMLAQPILAKASVANSSEPRLTCLDVKARSMNRRRFCGSGSTETSGIASKPMLRRTQPKATLAGAKGKA